MEEGGSDELSKTFATQKDTISILQEVSSYEVFISILYI